MICRHDLLHSKDLLYVRVSRVLMVGRGLPPFRQVIPLSKFTMVNKSRDTDDALLARLNALKKTTVTLAPSKYATWNYPPLSQTN